MSIRSPNGGRLLVMANLTPALPSARTAAIACGVSRLSFVTKVPSTSEISSAIGRPIPASPLDDRAPSASSAREELVGRFRSFAARFVPGDPAPMALPALENGLHNPPARLNIVGPLKQRRIPH